MEPDQLQQVGPAYCVIAQQYSSFVVSLRFRYSEEKFVSQFKNVYFLLF
jgi:hypothetical protein